MRILIIEDEPRLLELLWKGLYEQGHTPMSASDGEIGLTLAKTHQFDAIVLDLGLPGLDGFELIQDLRGNGMVTPVLVLTARDTEDDIIRGLELGADDYLTKPFSFAEMLARLISITRRQREQRAGTIEAGEVVIDPIRRSVTRNLKRIDLTPTEFRLLAYLVRQAGQCAPRHVLKDQIWGSDQAVSSSALDVLVNSLRNKIDSHFNQKLIGTVRGEGYVFHHSFDANMRS